MIIYKKLLLILLSAALFGCYVGSCAGLPEQPTSNDIVNYSWKYTDNIDESSQINEINIYFDASKTMRNYISMDPKVKTNYTKFLELIGSNPFGDYTFACYKFGEQWDTLLKSTSQILKAANRRDFYDHNWTRLGELIDEYNSKPIDNLSAMIITTDFVQSNSFKDSAGNISNWLYVKQGIAKHLKRGDFRIIAFKSPYQGKHESDIGIRFDVSTPLLRPVYCLIFTPKKEDSELLIDKILKNISSANIDLKILPEKTNYLDLDFENIDLYHSEFESKDNAFDLILSIDSL